MNEINLGIFIVPSIVTALLVVSYVYFSKQIQDRTKYRTFILYIALAAFFMNLIWEVSQGFLYLDFQYNVFHISFCALGSVADMLMVLLMLFGFGLIYKDVYWVNTLSIKRIFWLMLTGFLGANLAEIWHVARGDWAYAETMPLIPFTNAGFAPVLQFTLLPLIIFILSSKVLQFRNAR